MSEATDPLYDPAIYDPAIFELLGVLACGELLAFERMAHDAALAPTIEDKAALAGMAAGEFAHYAALRDRLAELGIEPTVAMTPFLEPLMQFHARTAPSDWLEGLIKAYVGNGMVNDFYREISVHMDSSTRELVIKALADEGAADFVVDRVRRAIAQDPRVAGRLALWARRLVGEALSQAQRVAAEHEGLTSLLVGDERRDGIDLAEIGRMFARITEAHVRRMERLGLAA
jgi:hypothetical protein